MKKVAEYLSLLAFAVAGFLILFAMTYADPNEVMPCALGGLVMFAVAMGIAAIGDCIK